MVLPFRSARLSSALMFAVLAFAPAGARGQGVEVRGVNAIDFGSIDRQVDMALDDLPPGETVVIETPTHARVRIAPLADRPDLAVGPGGGDCRAYRYDYTHADESATLEIRGIRCRSPGGYWIMLGDEEIVRVRPRGGGAVATAPASAPGAPPAGLSAAMPAEIQPPRPVGIPKPNPAVLARAEAAAAAPAEPAPPGPAPAAAEPAAADPAAAQTAAAPEPAGGAGRVVYGGGPTPAVAVAGEPDADVVAGLQLLRYLPPDQPASAGETGRALAEFAADEGVAPDVAVLRARLDDALSRNRMLVSCGRTGPGACLRAR